MKETLTDFFEQYTVKGFLEHREGLALYELALEVKPIGPCLEIGSYCGKSSVYIGSACRKTANTLYSVDHHKGSEEHQPGEEYFDQDVFDEKQQCINSLPLFQSTLKLASVAGVVIPVICSSQVLAKNWYCKLGMVFIDGSHSHMQARHDCMEWSRHVAVGGYMAIHDIFEKPENGGQGPYLGMKAVLEDDSWRSISRTDSLAVLQKEK